MVTLGEAPMDSYGSTDLATQQEIVERHSTLETANTDLAEIQTESETKIEETAPGTAAIDVVLLFLGSRFVVD